VKPVPFDPTTIVIAEDIPEDDQPMRAVRTWLLRWRNACGEVGDTTAMTEDEADMIAHALRYWWEHGGPA